MLIVRHTPALAPYRDRRVVGEIVTGQHDALAEVVAKRAGIRYVHYEPNWIDEFYAAYPQRRRRATFAGEIDDGI